MEIKTAPIIPVDFGNADSDGAIRMVTCGTLEALNRDGVTLSEGMAVQLTDGEILAFATTTFRDGMWVAIVDRWLKT